jgi:uncharacterized paraquat-inducible protein A
MGLQKWKEINVYLLSSTTPFFVLLSSAVVRIGVNCARLFACLLLLVGNSIYTQRKNVAMPSSGQIANHFYQFLLLNLQQNGKKIYNVHLFIPFSSSHGNSSVVCSRNISFFSYEADSGVIKL